MNGIVDHERIWLEPNCEGSSIKEEGRTWCCDPVYETCPECGVEPTEYVRADIVDRRLREAADHIERLEAALASETKEVAHWFALAQENLTRAEDAEAALPPTCGSRPVHHQRASWRHGSGL